MKKLALATLFLLVSGTAIAGLITTLMTNAATTGAGTSINYSSIGTIPRPNIWFQATLNGASAVSATVEIDGSTDNTNWVPLTTFSLTAASATLATAVVTTAPYIRGNLTAISGSGASVTVRSGE